MEQYSPQIEEAEDGSFIILGNPQTKDETQEITEVSFSDLVYKFGFTGWLIERNYKVSDLSYEEYRELAIENYLEHVTDTIKLNTEFIKFELIEEFIAATIIIMTCGEASENVVTPDIFIDASNFIKAILNESLGNEIEYYSKKYADWNTEVIITLVDQIIDFGMILEFGSDDSDEDFFAEA